MKATDKGGCRPSFKKRKDALHGGSPASYALRFAAGFPGMLMVLSSMSNMEQMQDNISFMQDFRPQSVRLSQMRQMRKGLSPASAHPQAARGCGEGI